MLLMAASTLVMYPIFGALGALARDRVLQEEIAAADARRSRAGRQLQTEAFDA